MSQINEEALQAFVDGLKLGLPPEKDQEVLEETFPEVRHISPESSQEERLTAFAKLRRRLGLRPIQDALIEK